MSSSSRLLWNSTTRFLSKNRPTPTYWNTNVRCFSEIVPGVGQGKTSTGIVGLAVDPNAISKIITTNQALLDRLNASDMPQDATYRTNIEAIAKHRIQICQDHPTDPEAVEEAVQMGQVEELVEQAEKEMAVLEMYLDRRMWECVEQVDIQFDPERDDAKKEEEE